MAGEKPAHHKPKVSRATLIVPGLGGPKANPNGVVDGQLVDIPALGTMHLDDASSSRPCPMGMSWPGRRGLEKSRLKVVLIRTANRRRWVSRVD